MPQIILPLRKKYVFITGTYQRPIVISDCNSSVLPVYPEGGVPRCRTCDAAVRGLCQRSQQQTREWHHGGAVPPQHCDKRL